jgi:hypothetical protein
MTYNWNIEIYLQPNVQQHSAKEKTPDDARKSHIYARHIYTSIYINSKCEVKDETYKILTSSLIRRAKKNARAHIMGD